MLLFCCAKPCCNCARETATLFLCCKSPRAHFKIQMLWYCSYCKHPQRWKLASGITKLFTYLSWAWRIWVCRWVTHKPSLNVSSVSTYNILSCRDEWKTTWSLIRSIIFEDIFHFQPLSVLCIHLGCRYIVLVSFLWWEVHLSSYTPFLTTSSTFPSPKRWKFDLNFNSKQVKIVWSPIYFGGCLSPSRDYLCTKSCWFVHVIPCIDLIVSSFHHHPNWQLT